ncbi:MAG: hypothetical protein LQ349_001756 [Xanthoria aureola]|nr:MAG: hypothetical protein LQ349_001756 [Xanthoria aureola]
MDTMTLPISPKNPLKRTYSDTRPETPLPDSVKPTTLLEAPVMSTLESSTQTSLMPSQPVASVTLSDAANPILHPATPFTATNAPAATTASSLNSAKKRTKLTESEKAVKRQEKEAKELEKANQKAKKEEEKIRKEEEKAKKDEERRAKDAEKERKRQEKEQQTRLKEEEKRKKEEDKEKKHKSQMRLNAFFAPPSLTNDGSTASLPLGSPSPANSRRSSIISLHGEDTPTRERSASATPGKTRPSEYARRFRPFFLQSYTILAPPNRFERDEEGLQYTQRQIDERLADPSITKDKSSFDLNEMLHISPYKRRKLNGPQPCVKEIMERLHGTSQNPIDLTASQRSRVAHQPLDLLKTVPTKFLKFVEDVRPPYIGTYTRVRDRAIARQICRNPFTRGLPATDYDYDSEAEWEEPGEGEDLDSEGEEEIESEDGDDMEGFLDDEDSADSAKALQKRRLVTGNLEPISTGLCWEDDGNYQALRDLAQYHLEVMLEDPKAPIDPYSTAYWQTATSTTLSTSTSCLPQPVMEPPRIPLTAINHANVPMPYHTSALDVFKPPTSTPVTNPNKMSKPSKRMVAPEVMEDFKRAVNGSDLTKAGLIEILKKQFPKQSKDAIKDTLGTIAERVGPKEKDKRWVVKDASTSHV